MDMDDRTLSALCEALDDEYKARATYRAVLDRFGDVRPFSNIVHAEERHIQALLTIFNRHGVEPPGDRWAGQVESPETLEAACKGGVQAEIENDEMYERLLPDLSDPDIRAVMRRLQEASRDRHLPAFRRCVRRHGSSCRS